MVMIVSIMFFTGAKNKIKNPSVLECESKLYPINILGWEESATHLAKMTWGEARGEPIIRQAACMWCVLNRVDAGYGDIISVITSPGQFLGYVSTNPIDQEILDLAFDVIARWQAEINGIQDVGRVIPSDYLWFTGRNNTNWFRNAYIGGITWDWSLPNPYENK